MEVRAIYENREASKCRRLILDSPDLSKTVVAEMNRCRHGHGSRLSFAAVSVSALVSATERVAAAPTHLETAIYVLDEDSDPR